MRARSFFVPLLLLLSGSRLHSQSELPSQASIEGQIINATTGQPVAGARVKIAAGDRDEPIFVRTGDDGKFASHSLPPAVYHVNAEMPGFLPASATADLRHIRSFRGQAASPFSSRIERLPSAADTLRLNVTVPLIAYAVITGKVTDPDGLPIAGCDIEVVVDPKHPPSQRINGIRAYHIRTRTNDQGEYRAAPLEPGTYHVRAGNETARQMWLPSYRATYFPSALDTAFAKPVELSPGQHARADIQIAQRTGVRISGRLTIPPLPASARMPATVVALTPESNPERGPIRHAVATRDTYEISGVLPGRYTLIAVTQDAGERLTDPVPLFGVSKSIEVGERNAGNIDLPLESLRDISGTVEFTEGCEPQPVRVSLSGYTPVGGTPSAVVTNGGEFTMPAVLPGHYRVNTDSTTDPRVPLIPVSVQLGGRDILKDGFDAPISTGDALRITVACRPGRPR